jgi:hypothetical protein
MYAEKLPALCDMVEQELVSKLETLEASNEFDVDVFVAFDGQYKQLSAVAALLSKIHDKFQRSVRRVKQLEHGSLFFGLPSKEELLKILSELKEDFRRYKEPVLAALSNFSPEEVKRMDEAFYTLRERCYWSTMVNSAAAFESRLLALLRRRNLKFLRTLNKDLEFGLGELSNTYLQNLDQFTRLLPPGYDDLLNQIDSYRLLFSHPDQFSVDERNAEILFTQTLRFLCDPECQAPKKREPKKKQEDTYMV